jgi:alkyl hydroperoxide reductase subunit AhpF
VAYFSDADARILADRLQSLQSPVRLAFFTQSLDCDRCPTTKGILDGLVAASAHLTVDERNLVLDKELAEAMGIERVPAVAIVGQVDAGVRFYGAPEGYELVSLLDAILAASANDSGLSAATRERVKGLTEPLHLQVFSTPT